MRNKELFNGLIEFGLESLDKAYEFGDPGVDAMLARHREQQKDPKFRKKLAKQWERLSLKKYPPELRREIKARRVAGHPHPMDRAYAIKKRRKSTKLEALEDLFEFGAKALGIQKMRTAIGKDGKERFTHWNEDYEIAKRKFIKARDKKRELNYKPKPRRNIADRRYKK